VAGGPAEGDVQRLALRLGELLAELEDRRAQLLQRRVVELLVALDASRLCRATPPCRPR